MLLNFLDLLFGAVFFSELFFYFWIGKNGRVHGRYRVHSFVTFPAATSYLIPVNVWEDHSPQRLLSRSVQLTRLV